MATLSFYLEELMLKEIGDQYLSFLIYILNAFFFFNFYFYSLVSIFGLWEYENQKKIKKINLTLHVKWYTKSHSIESSSQRSIEIGLSTRVVYFFKRLYHQFFFYFFLNYHIFRFQVKLYFSKDEFNIGKVNLSFEKASSV